LKTPPTFQAFDYQRSWVDDLSQFKIINKARQVGITYAETMSIVHRLMGKQMKWYYLSISEDRAKEAIEYAIQHALMIGISMTSRNLDADFFEDTKYKQLTLSFPNGSKLVGLPANPRTARGCSGNVTLDEFAHHHDAKTIWQAVHPLAVTWKYFLHAISTPNGLQGEFARIWTGKDNLGPDEIERLIRAGQIPIGDNWSRHLINIEDAAAQGHPVNVEQCREMAGDEDTFQQEYMCKFLDEAYAWLPYSLLESATHQSAVIHWDATQKPAGPVWAGFDVGRKHDLSVLWLNEQRGMIHTTRGIIAMDRLPFSQQRGMVWDVMPHVSRINIDQNGIGAQLAEETVDYWGTHRAEGISSSGTVPAKLATKLRGVLERGELLIPDDPDVRRDLHMVRRTYTDLGKVRFEAPRTRDGHADRFWAAALAINAADAVAPTLRSVPRAHWPSDSICVGGLPIARRTRLRPARRSNTQSRT
jgi:phage FluMu gp28-like protein